MDCYYWGFDYIDSYRCEITDGKSCQGKNCIYYQEIYNTDDKENTE